jgi:putative ABC transport system permease protein
MRLLPPKETKGSGTPGTASVLETNIQVDQTKLLTYTEITPANIGSFHFHGDPATYPINAVIAVPPDQRATTLLRGRYLDPRNTAQIVDPAATTQSLLQNIFRVGALFDGVLLLVGIATLLIVALVFALSLRLRQREIDTIVLLGCSRLTVLRLAAAELVLVALASSGLCLLLLALVRHYSTELGRHFVIP